MTQPNKKVDAYIGKSAQFAKPILNHLRAVILATCPEVEEDIKWGIPHYSYKGDHLCMMAAFSKHCSFSLYKAESMEDEVIQDSVKAGKKFGYMDKVKDVSELPDKKVLVAYIKESMALNESGVKKQKPAKEKTAADVEMPAAFTDALKQNAKADAIFESKSPSFRKQYIQWIAGAKTTDTQQKRIEQSIGWIAAGKDRFWQYKGAVIGGPEGSQFGLSLLSHVFVDAHRRYRMDEVPTPRVGAARACEECTNWSCRFMPEGAQEKFDEEERDSLFPNGEDDGWDPDK